jgi:aminopeptidase N
MLHTDASPPAGQPPAQGAYTVTDSSLALLQPPDRQFTLQITNKLSLRWATGSVGLARSVSGSYITQCESEGFRRLTYFLDRPDVRSNFTVRIEADESACPVLLSNGNLRGAGKLPRGRHYAIYEVRSTL